MFRMQLDGGLFDDREAAGKALADELAKRGLVRPVVYALPRGGVPVAVEIAGRLDAPLDLLMVRKIGAPGQPELAAGAVVDGGQPEPAGPDLVLIDEIVRATGMTEDDIAKAARAGLAENERRRARYLAGRPPVPAQGRTAILVDDGIATGATMAAAIKAIRRRAPLRIVVAAPVAPRDAVMMLRDLVDDVVCLAVPERFDGVGEFYRDFHQLGDSEVVALLAGAAPGKLDQD